MIVKYGKNTVKNETKTVKIDAQEVGNPKCPHAPPHCIVPRCFVHVFLFPPLFSLELTRPVKGSYAFISSLSLLLKSSDRRLDNLQTELFTITRYHHLV